MDAERNTQNILLRKFQRKTRILSETETEKEIICFILYVSCEFQ